MRKRYDWAAIQRYHDQGHSRDECIARFGFCLGSWYEATARGDLKAEINPMFHPGRRRYDWAEIQAYYDEGNSVRRCIERFGFGLAAWGKAVKRGDVRARPQRRPIAEVLLTSKCRTHVKERLLRAGLLENRCSRCGLLEWLSQPLSMHIDHINGVKNDNRLENLRMLCPNCHSQTPTYGGRNNRRSNRGRGHVLQDPPPLV